MKIRTHTRLLWSLLAASALIRVVFFFQARNLDVFSVPILDCRTYHEWALRLLAGNLDWNEAYWMGPLYPHLLALGYWIFGTSHQVVMVVQLALSLLNIWLVYKAGMCLLSTGEKEIAGRARVENMALFAAFLYALYAAPIFYAGMKLMAVMVTTVMLLVALQAHRVSRQGTVANWFVLGLLVGFGGLARGNFLILLAAFPLLLWQRGLPLVTRKSLSLVLALWLGGLVMIAPATLRNIIVGRDLVVLTSNGGVNLLIGQQSAYNGMFAPADTELKAENDMTMALVLESEVGHALKGSEISRMLTARAWQTFRDDFKSMPRHYARKIFRFWNGYEVPQISSYDYWREEISSLKLLPLPFMVFSALGLLGLAYLPAAGNHYGRRIILIVVLGYFLSLLPFFPTARYRQPLVPFLAISAAVYLFHLAQLAWNNDPGKTRAKALTHVGLSCLMILFMHPIWMALDPSLVKWQVALNEAMRGAQKGDKEQVIFYGKLAEEFKPGMAWTSFSLAGNLEELGAWDEALLQYEKSAQISPDHPIITYRIGRNRENAGQYIEALKAFGRAAALDDAWAYPYLRTGLILRKLGKKDEALAAIRKAVALDPGNYRVRSNFASLLAETGDLAGAKASLLDLTNDFPGYVNGWYNLGLVELEFGQIPAALEALEKAEGIPGISESEQKQIETLKAVLAR